MAADGLPQQERLDEDDCQPALAHTEQQQSPLRSEAASEDLPACAEGGSVENGNNKAEGGLGQLSLGKALGGLATPQQKQEKKPATRIQEELAKLQAERLTKQNRCADYAKFKEKVDAWESKHSKVQQKRELIQEIKQQKEKEDQIQYKFYQCLSCACLKGKSLQQ